MTADTSLVFREGMSAMDFATVREWLANSYWVPGIERETIEHASCHSALVLGAFQEGTQVGFLRVVSDKSRFAYVCDVIVAETARGQGIARAMVQHVLNHHDFATVRTWTLATRDAHGVYAPLGFQTMDAPESRSETWMVLRRGPSWTDAPAS